MADPTISTAVNAYNAAAKSVGSKGLEPRDTVGVSFGELLQGIKDNSIAAGKADEQQTMKAAAGTANVTEVVTAVSAAEVTLQAVTAVRDRVISAYQDIIRMPI
ncbi:MAG: flagellar hook-basal body complex protein FliE [Rhodospirillaceae bacterium]|nr:flagellar hook-basal body complex protein FliE [Rhodospirillaceae bacterium]